MRAPLAFAFSALVACSSRDEPAVRDAAPRLTAEPAADAGAPRDAARKVDAAARLKEARELERQNRWRDARAAAEEATTGGDPRALVELAAIAAQSGDVRRAEDAGRKVIEHPDADAASRATAYYHLGRAAELRGDEAAARDAYEQSLAHRDSTVVADRLARVAPRRPLPVPPAPPCARPRPALELCACLAAELAPQITAASTRCVTSHRHGGDAWAVTLVARDAAPTYLVTQPAKGQAQVVAAIGPTRGADTTIVRWDVLPGPDGAPLVRVDSRTSLGREDAILCVTGERPRCLAAFPIEEQVTPGVKRRLDVAVQDGVAHVTVVEGPTAPSDVLGSHRLW